MNHENAKASEQPSVTDDIERNLEQSASAENHTLDLGSLTLRSAAADELPYESS